MKPRKRSEALLLDVAGQFEHGTPALHHEWLRDNQVSSDELAGLTDKLAAIVRGYVQSPQHVQLAIIAASAMPDKQTGHVVSALLDQRRAQRHHSFSRTDGTIGKPP